MTDELVKRLRDFDPHLHEWEVVDEAADRIEQLTADRDRLRAASDDVIRETFASYRQAEEAYAAHLRAEADNARLREALGKLECKCSANCDWERDDVCPSWIARAALKGESHD